MTDNQMLYCLIAFILGWLVSRQIRNGFIVELFDVGGQRSKSNPAHWEMYSKRAPRRRRSRRSSDHDRENNGH